MNKCIVINGPSSSGKSTIIDIFRKNHNFLHFGIDILWKYIIAPSMKEFGTLSKDYFHIGKDNQTVFGPKAIRLLHEQIRMIENLRQIHHVIVDDVILTREHMMIYKTYLDLDNCFIFNLDASKSLLESREIKRNLLAEEMEKRPVGLALCQYQMFQSLDWSFDLKIKVDYNNINEIEKAILKHISCNSPSFLKTLY